jgi:Asp-tRNA(Asn)/Glu-tRNA(Gln) amidotransferase A subunit family amidase
MGRVPLYPGTKDERYPGVSGWESLEHIGPLTRTVADAALILSVIAGYRRPGPAEHHLRRRRLAAGRRGRSAGVRVAYSPDLGYAAVDPAVRSVVDRAASVFERDLGCSVEQDNPGWDDPYEALDTSSDALQCCHRSGPQIIGTVVGAARPSLTFRLVPHRGMGAPPSCRQGRRLRPITAHHGDHRR